MDDVITTLNNCTVLTFCVCASFPRPRAGFWGLQVWDEMRQGWAGRGYISQAWRSLRWDSSHWGTLVAHSEASPQYSACTRWWCPDHCWWSCSTVSWRGDSSHHWWHHSNVYKPMSEISTTLVMQYWKTQSEGFHLITDPSSIKANYPVLSIVFTVCTLMNLY